MQTVLRTLALFPGWTEDPAGHLADVERLAADYAKRNGHDAAAVLADLDALAGRIAAAAAELSDVQDMQAFTAAGLELGASGAAAGDLDACDRRADHLARQRQLYASLFDAVCRALAAVGFTLTAHQIGGHQFTHQQRRSLAQLTARPRRLEDDQAAAIYWKLTENGYITGPISAFMYYFGPTVHPEAEKPTAGLIWAKSTALFGVFVFTLAKIMQQADKPDYDTFIEAFPNMNAASLESAVSRARCAEYEQSKSRRATRGRAELIRCFNEALSITLKK